MGAHRFRVAEDALSASELAVAFGEDERCASRAPVRLAAVRCVG